MSGKVYITDYIVNPNIERKIFGKNFSLKKNKEIEVLLVWNQIIDNKYLKQFPNLKGIVRYGVGIDKINKNDIQKRNLIVCNTPDYASDEVSDTALAYLLMITRGVSKYNYDSRKNFSQWKFNTTIKQIKRSSKTVVGVIGAGRIGSKFIKKSILCGFETIYFDPYLKKKCSHGKRCNNLNNLLAKSDVISVHTPLTKKTKNMIDASFLKKMKKGSSIINTARGKIIKNLDLLYKKLKSNSLFTVALDVLPYEPPIKDNFIKEWLHNRKLASRIIINPHVSYYSVQSYEECRIKASKNAKKILMGKKPNNIVYDYRK
tara:strand:- start:1085 stop:2035 length:951 start_codon:yes stop_codon:yes gene_type:complete